MRELGAQRTPEVILMVDDHYLAGKENVKRFFHQPVKFEGNPILKSGEVKWELIPLLFGSVRFDPFVGKYRMWYLCNKSMKLGLHKWVDYRSSLALAESKDGIKWKRVKIKGKQDNCVFGSAGKEIFIEAGSVLIEEDAPPSRRYVMVYCAKKLEPYERYYRIAFSPDGIRWRRGQKIPISLPAIVDRHGLVKNSVKDEYLFFCRGKKPINKKISTTEGYERTVCLQKSKDLVQWTKPIEVMCVDSKERGKGFDIYSLYPFYRGDTLMGIYQLHDLRKEGETVSLHLSWSYDGVDWKRRKEEFIPLGGIGEWDRFNNAIADAPLIIGDEMHFYYSGRTYRHGGYAPDGKVDTGPYFAGIGLAKMKVDRFASLGSSFDGGELRTRKFLWPGSKKLYLNAKCRWGRIEVSLISGKVEKKVVIEGRDEVCIPVKLSTKPDSVFSLIFRLYNSEIYAIYWK